MTPLNFDKAEGADMAPDTLLIKLPMGTSKTKALVEYLNSDQVPKDARVIIISFCKSFTSELLNNIGCDFVDYQTVDGIINHDKVIVQVIAMDADAGFRTYDLLASSRKHVQMINNLWKPSPKEAPIDMYYDQPEAFLATIVAATTKAKTEPFVVVSTSRTQAKVIHKHCLAACPDAVIKK